MRPVSSSPAILIRPIAINLQPVLQNKYPAALGVINCKRLLNQNKYKISGTTFEREGLQAMLAEVDKANIGTMLQDVITQIEQLHRKRGKSKVPAHRRLLEVSAPTKRFPEYHRTGRKTSAEKIFLRISKPVPAGI